eukprot:3307375-Pyramimonas_sp.AAC.1
MESICCGEAVVVDVEDGDFELEAGIRDPKPGGAAMDDDLKPGARTQPRGEHLFAFVVRNEDAHAACVGYGGVVGHRGGVERLARVLGRVGQEGKVVDRAVCFLDSD